MLLGLKLPHHLHDDGLASVVGVHARLLEELSLGEALLRESAVLQSSFWGVNALGVIHLVDVQEILHDVRGK